MQKNIDLTKEQLDELNELFRQLKQIENLAEKSSKEKLMSEVAGTLLFILTGCVMLYIGIHIIGYLVWIAIYGFLLYYFFCVRKSGFPKYDECVIAAKVTVCDCIKIIEHNQIAEIVYDDTKFYIHKYNKLINYYPDIASNTLKMLIHCKPKS